jgi:hypothetical protein
VVKSVQPPAVQSVEPMPEDDVVPALQSPVERQPENGLQPDPVE